MSRKPGRASPMAPDERRQAIVEAVVPLLVSHGAAVTTRQIAEAAGVAEGTIYRVFPDKCALMYAAAEATLDPHSSRGTLATIDTSLDLHHTVHRVAAHLLERMETVMAVMIAVRGMIAPPTEQSPDTNSHADPRPGPPAFLTEANRAMLEVVTEVFDRHRDDLRVPPERAALLLRSLVFGSRHPGMDDAPALTADEIASVLVCGISAASRPS